MGEKIEEDFFIFLIIYRLQRKNSLEGTGKFIGGGEGGAFKLPNNRYTLI